MNGIHAARLIRVTVIVALVALALTALTAPALAGVKPVILAATADLGAGTLTIAGISFGSVAPIVKLGGDLLTVVQSSQTEIVATLPPGLTDGSYLLSVKKTGAAEVTSMVTLDANAGSDGPGREIQDFASNSENGPNPTSQMQFLVTPIEVTTTKMNQPVLVISSRAFGTSANDANMLTIFVCYQAPSGPLTTAGNGMWALRLRALAKSTQIVHGVIQPPTPGTYLVGMCGNSTSPYWNDNDYGMTTVLVF